MGEGHERLNGDQNFATSRAHEVEIKKCSGMGVNNRYGVLRSVPS
jgi:hypothetical protein